MMRTKTITNTHTIIYATIERTVSVNTKMNLMPTTTPPPQTTHNQGFFLNV